LQTTYSVADLPIEYNVGEEIYFGITAQVEPSDEGLNLFTVECLTKPDIDSDSIDPYYLIENG